MHAPRHLSQVVGRDLQFKKETGYIISLKTLTTIKTAFSIESTRMLLYV